MKADIFFFISSVSTVIVTILTIILFYYLIKAARALQEISEVIKSGVKDSEQFIEDLRERLDANFVFRMFFPPTRKRRQRTAKDDTIQE